MQSGWAVHFIDTDGKTRIGPWLLCDSSDEVIQILTWGSITHEGLGEHHLNIKRWGIGGAICN